MLRLALVTTSLLLTSATLANAQAVGNRVRVNGMQMYYEVSGTGDPLVVLHGAYMNIPTMGAIIPRLAKTHKVYAVELQGHGRTTAALCGTRRPRGAGDGDSAITLRNIDWPGGYVNDL